jgi:hypothetical protein
LCCTVSGRGYSLDGCYTLSLFNKPFFILTAFPFESGFTLNCEGKPGSEEEEIKKSLLKSKAKLKIESSPHQRG